MDWISAHRSRVYDIVRLVSYRLARPASRLSRSKCTPRLSRLRLRFRRIPTPQPRVRASLRPTGSRSRAPTSAPRGGRPPPLPSTSPRPTGSRSRAPISAPRGGRPSPPTRTSPRPTGIFSRAHFSTSRWSPSAANAHVHSSHGQPFSRAHCSTSRWPPCAAAQHVRSCHGKFSARRSAFNASRSPIRAAAAQRRRSSDSRPLRRRHLSVLRYPRQAAPYSSNSSTFRPVASTASRMPLLTARSTARSAGSGRCFSTSETARWKGKARKSDARLRVEVRFRLRARVSTPRVASLTIAAGAACAVRVVALPRARRCVCRARDLRSWSSLFVFAETLFRDFHSRVVCSLFVSCAPRSLTIV